MMMVTIIIISIVKLLKPGYAMTEQLWWRKILVC